jgi:hypothetical protein
MSNTAKQHAFEVFELLTEREQTLVYELIKSLAPDDVATPEDISAHAAAMNDYQRGDTVAHDQINWN